MAARAAVVVPWPPEQQICREFIEAVEEVMGQEKLSAGSGSGWMDSTEESLKIKQRRAVYERPSCKKSVFGKILPSKRCRSAHAMCNILVIKY